MADAREAHFHALMTQESTFPLEIAAESAEGATGADDAMAWDAGIAAFAHDVADRPVCARAAGERGDVTVGGDAARRNPADGSQYTRAK